MKKQLDNLAINTLRFLSVETIQKANSGHPGLPLGASPMAYTLWSKHLKHNPKNPNWIDRDRFVLSAGHGSALLYSLLHLFNYGVTTEDLKGFRQLDSKTPGHPEYGHTVGVEVTTGPLGQGIANAVGFAMAESHLAEKFNKPNMELVDHYTYAICGDGCLMEGVASEASSLAGTLGLGKLIVLYDSNNITIEGDTNIAFREDVRKRYDAYGWQTLYVEDGNDIDSISKAIETAKSDENRPTLIEIKTIIGFGSPNKQGTHDVHGAPLGDEEIKLTKQNLGWEHTEPFFVPNDVKEHINDLQCEFENKEKQWHELIQKYETEYPEAYKEWVIWNENKVDMDILNSDEFWNYEEDTATRVASYKVLNKISEFVPNLFGGSADLAPSNKSNMDNRGHYLPEDKSGSNLHFGVREHAMGAIGNGIALHGGLKTYNAGFFVFCDYMRPSMRLAALMNLPVISILTHDSIGVGEDGPTHQPVEHLASLRSIPNYTVMRPCDTKETVASWYLALTRQSPSGIVLTRQNLPLLKETSKEALKGGYILRDCEGTPDIILMASGSEVQLVYKAYDDLTAKGKKVRVVSMLSMEVFEEQPDEYKKSVLPLEVTKRVAVEAGVEIGWHKYVGLEGKVICMEGYGASAPANLLFEKFGFTVENVVDTALELLK